MARVIHNGRSEDPRFAPSMSEIPTIRGKASSATSVTIINTTAKEECMINVRKVPTRNAVMKSRLIKAEICSKNVLSRIGITVARIDSKAIRTKATPSSPRPICFGIEDLLFKNIKPPDTNSNGASQPIFTLRN